MYGKKTPLLDLPDAEVLSNGLIFVNDAPIPSPSPLMVAAAVIYQNNKVLVSKRRPGGVLGGLWEFPGGKQERGEGLEDCLRRELQEELGVQVGALHPFLVVKHSYPNQEIELHFYLSTSLLGDPQPLGCSEWAWLDPGQLRSLPFPEADRRVIQKIEEIHRAKTLNERPFHSIHWGKNKEPL